MATTYLRVARRVGFVNGSSCSVVLAQAFFIPDANQTKTRYAPAESERISLTGKNLRCLTMNRTLARCATPKRAVRHRYDDTSESKPHHVGPTSGPRDDRWFAFCRNTDVKVCWIDARIVGRSAGLTGNGRQHW